MVPLDLTRHAVLDASAGTGKTHFLIGHVVRLLTEKHVSLDQILLVTFTDKATGELKVRLRDMLEKLAADNPEQRSVALAALDIFDQAAIFTIHGFCQRVLQDHAFDNRQDFAAELVHDEELLESALREVQRGAWQQDYGDLLALILEISAYQSEGWEKHVKRLVTDFRSGSNNIILPEKQESLVDALHNW